MEPGCYGYKSVVAHLSLLSLSLGGVKWKALGKLAIHTKMLISDKPACAVRNKVTLVY